MLQVISSRSFHGKNDPSKMYHVVNLIGEDGQVAVDVWVDSPIPVGSYVTVKERITQKHQLSCTVVPVAEKK